MFKIKNYSLSKQIMNTSMDDLRNSMFETEIYNSLTKEAKNRINIASKKGFKYHKSERRILGKSY